MWLFLPNSFLSIVDKGDPTGKTLLVRARRAGEIEAVFPDAKVRIGGGTDYGYRARIDRDRVAEKMAKLVRSIDYGNFKDQVHDDERHDAYFRVWRAMLGYQDTE